MKKIVLFFCMLSSHSAFSQYRSEDGFKVAVSGVQVKGVPFEINSTVYTRKEIRGIAVLTDKSGNPYQRPFVWKLLKGSGTLEVSEDGKSVVLSYDTNSQTFTYNGQDYLLSGKREILLQGLLAYAKGNKRASVLKETGLEKIARKNFDAYFGSAYGFKAEYTLGLAINTVQERLTVLPEDIALSKRENTGYSVQERLRMKEGAEVEQRILENFPYHKRSTVDLYRFFTVVKVPSLVSGSFTSSFMLTLDEEGKVVLPPRDVVL